MQWNWDHMGPWSMVRGWLFLALLIVGLVVLGAVLVRLLIGRGQRHDPRPSGRSRARKVLDERYARGEINGTDYDERRRRLDNDARA
ncbi:MAG TPA: amino acid acetyltransferase [Beutenbergiaceae bacterium]|nr:amino acid acetyltransferase [Beutenbergiaceae bacterium]